MAPEEREDKEVGARVAVALVAVTLVVGALVVGVLALEDKVAVVAGVDLAVLKDFCKSLMKKHHLSATLTKLLALKIDSPSRLFQGLTSMKRQQQKLANLP